MFPIIPRRNVWFAFSGTLLVASILSVAIFGLNLGIDFTGGTRLQVHFQNDRPQKDTAKNTFEEAVGAEKGESISEVLDANDLLIRSRTLGEEELSALEKAFSAQYPGSEIVSANTIGASVGAVFQKRAFIAVGLAVAAIILFVAFAFRTVPEGYSSWKFGLAAIVALVHDITLVIGFFALIGQ